ncbi:MAG: PilZ domain-containing protein [Acidobacteria bacterium]|nr:PilZ domain-containing protein [Acidobacteriota bacterium]MCH8319684.1 PilZ domain-containing protein [Acidobacteriota bacterium]
MNEKEKRAATRLDVPFAGIMTFETKGEGLKVIEVVAKEASEEGAYLWADAPSVCPEVGDKIGLNLRCTSDRRRLRISLEATGTVVRVDEPENDSQGLAVKFEAISDS